MQVRIVLIHRYFWPDTSPYGILLRRIAEHLASDGNEITVLTGQPTYGSDSESGPVQFRQELGDRLTVRRARLLSERRMRPVFRAFNDVWFCLRIIFHLLWHRPKIVMCSTQPPVIGAASASFVARLIGAKFVYHLQDIHPEVVTETGHVGNSFVMRLLKWIDTRTIRRANQIVVLSDDMRKSLEQRDQSVGQRTTIIPNFNLPRFDDNQIPSPELTKTPGRFRLMFAGNIGKFQNLEAIVQACLEIPKEKDFEFVLLGDGKAKEGLRELAGDDDRIVFIPRQPLSIAEPLMAESDLCVVSLEEIVHRYAFPSKLASYLSLGAAILVVCEPQSELSRIAEENGFGLSVAQSPANAIGEKILWAIDHPHEIARMRENAVGFFGDNFAVDKVMQQWSQLIDSVQ